MDINLGLLHKCFVPISPVEELKPIEALALVNRWMKLKHYFYYEDLNALYELKDQKIVEFVKAGEMQATTVIVRESLVD